MIESNWLSCRARVLWWGMLSAGSPMGDLPCRNKLCTAHSLLKVIDKKPQLFVTHIHKQTFFHKLVKILRDIATERATCFFFSERLVNTWTTSEFYKWPIPYILESSRSKLVLKPFYGRNLFAKWVKEIPRLWLDQLDPVLSYVLNSLIVTRVQR